MSDAIITNIINNIFHAAWFYNLVLEPKHGKKTTLLITILAGIFFQIFIFIFTQLGLPKAALFLSAYLLTAVVFGGVFCFCSQPPTPQSPCF